VIRKILFLIRYHLFHKHRINRTRREKVLGEKFLVLPGVFSPKSYYSSKIFAAFVCGLDDLTGKHVLDMGCGSGIIGIFAAKKGADVVAVDINPDSVECASRNAAAFDLRASKFKAIQSNLFENIKDERFDIIFFNPPYYNREPRDSFEMGFFGGKELRVVKQFAEQSKEHLTPQGIIYLIVSSDVNLDFVTNFFTENGFKNNLVLNKKKLFEKFYIFRFEM
jgi:release factor glutamine methyltransferase